jgi:hypothetical protein
LARLEWAARGEVGEEAGEVEERQRRQLERIRLVWHVAHP